MTSWPSYNKEHQGSTSTMEHPQTSRPTSSSEHISTLVAFLQQSLENLSPLPMSLYVLTVYFLLENSMQPCKISWHFFTCSQPRYDIMCLQWILQIGDHIRVHHCIDEYGYFSNICTLECWQLSLSSKHSSRIWNCHTLVREFQIAIFNMLHIWAITAIRVSGLVDLNCCIILHVFSCMS